jgi:hypothetical protein
MIPFLIKEVVLVGVDVYLLKQPVVRALPLFGSTPAAAGGRGDAARNCHDIEISLAGRTL